MADGRDLTSAADLAIIRAAYARQMVRSFGLDDPRVEAAFAAVPREDFLGGAPWSLIRSGSGRHTLARNDPVLVYQDVLVALDAARGVNNGSPALHALMLHHLGVRQGDRVLHVGAGGGYYSALLAELAGAAGQVAAIEFEPGLAANARGHLAPWGNVTVQTGDGAAFPTALVDRIYVNFAVARPAEAWLDHLAPGGTLLFPLAVPPPGDPAAQHGRGAVLALTRTDSGFAAKFVSPCSFVCAEGELAGDAPLRLRLHEAFQRGGVEFVASFRRGPSPPERCWFWSPEWSLSYDPPI
jgi:protein-L-isoaspartate(D-aspartate) O-methyltransferase